MKSSHDEFRSDSRCVNCTDHDISNPARSWTLSDNLILSKNDIAREIDTFASLGEVLAGWMIKDFFQNRNSVRRGGRM